MRVKRSSATETGSQNGHPRRPRRTEARNGEEHTSPSNSTALITRACTGMAVYADRLAERGYDLSLAAPHKQNGGGIDMTETKARQVVLAARPQGKPRLTDFRLEETAIPTPGPAQVLLRVQYLSLDPYMRGRMDDRKSYAPPVPLGGVMPGESVATVIASHHPGYSVGDLVLAQTGWRTHALSDRADLRKLDPAVAPVTTGLGVLGMPGFTAYGGLRVIGKPQPGETVVVAAASGPVGSLVGQLAKIDGE